MLLQLLHITDDQHHSDNLSHHIQLLTDMWLTEPVTLLSPSVHMSFSTTETFAEKD